MIDLLVRNGTVVTMNEKREILTDGAVAVDGSEIVDVGSTSELTGRYSPDREIDVADHLVLPGLISVHGHVSDILIRGKLYEGRPLYDWLFNVKKPAVEAMSPEDHAVASALYCQEAIRAGVTTFVELPESLILPDEDFDTITEAKRTEYAEAGLRSIYAVTFSDNTDVPDSLSTYIRRLTTTEQSVTHPDPQDGIIDTDAALDRIRELIETADEEKHSVWPAPEHIWTVTPDGFQGAYELAEEYDVMTTTHVSESTHDEVGHLSNIEYLDSCDFLGDRTILAHCVHLSDADMRLISETETKIAHNPLANLALGSGIAPVPKFLGRDITVGVGLDNPCVNNTVNPLNDLRYAALLHKGAGQDAGAVTAGEALEMVTIGAARALGRADELGSITTGKQADLVLLDTDYPHLSPRVDIASTIAYQAQGHEIETVLCGGEVIFEEDTVPGIEGRYSDLNDRAQRAAEAVLEKSGVAGL